MKVLRGARNGDVVASGARSWALSLGLLLLAILPGLSTATTADSLEVGCLPYILFAGRALPLLALFLVSSKCLVPQNATDRHRVRSCEEVPRLQYSSYIHQKTSAVD